MEKLRLQLSHFSIFGITSAISNPDLMWRVVLSLVAILATVISVISFLSYLWASHSAPAVTPTKKDRNVVTREEIRTALDLYQAKQTRFETLVGRRPQAPNLGGAYGAEGDITDVPAELINESGTVVPVPPAGVSR